MTSASKHSKENLRLRESEYLCRAHTTITHSHLAAELLRYLWRTVRRAGYKSADDVWKRLSDCEDVATAIGFAAPDGDAANTTNSSAGKKRVALKSADLKRAFRKYMTAAQQGRCCYCRRQLSGVAHAQPIEHVLPRVTYPHYAVDFWNLAVACYDCNSIKSKQDWSDGGFLVKSYRCRYPAPEQFDAMFHPRFHDYDEHIQYVRVETNSYALTIYKWRSSQGKKLCHDVLYKVAAKEIISSGNGQLSQSLKTIEGFGGDMDDGKLKRFRAFYEALEDKLSALAGVVD